MGLLKKVIYGGLWLVILTYIGYVVSLGGNIILVRLLVPEYFGIFALALSLANSVFIFFGFNFRSAVIHLQKEKDVFETGLVFSVITGLFTVLAGGIGAWIASYFISFQAALIIFLLGVSQFFIIVSYLYSASQEKEILFKRNAIIRFFCTTSALVLAIVMAYSGFGVWSLVAREIILSFFLFLGMMIFAPFKIRWKFNLKTAKKIWSYSYKTLITNGLGVINSRVSLFFIGAFGSHFLGLFSQAHYLAQAPTRFSTPLMRGAALPVYARIQDKKEKITEGLNWSTFFLVRFLVLVGVVAFFYNREIVNLLWGEKWMGAAVLLKGFSFYMVFHALFLSFSSIFLAIGKVQVIIKSLVIKMIVLYSLLGFLIAFKSFNLIPLAFSLAVFSAVSFLVIRMWKEKIFINLNKCFLRPLGYVLVLVCFNLVISPYVVPWFVRMVLVCILAGLLIIVFEKKEILTFLRRVKEVQKNDSF